MSQFLCCACRSLNPDFFSSGYDNVEFPNGPGVLHRPINWIRQSAKSGCPLCTCLIASASVDFLPPRCLEEVRVMLRRAIIDPDRAIAMFLGIDDVSKTFFSRVPQNWCHYDLARLGKPGNDIEIMKSWLRNCISQHSHCDEGITTFRPTRLLDVKAFKHSNDVKLVTLCEGRVTAGYVALSHCWGSYTLLKTVKSNLHQHYQRIPFFDLSTTFKDAVKLASDLDHRYLWIDSLCIVQDDYEDWAREAGTMASVYSNAVFTISALSSKDGAGGCRVRNPRSMMTDNPYFDFDLGPYRIRTFKKEITNWHEEYGDDTYRRNEHGKTLSDNERELCKKGNCRSDVSIFQQT